MSSHQAELERFNTHLFLCGVDEVGFSEVVITKLWWWAFFTNCAPTLSGSHSVYHYEL